jgi:hypothetical protein
VSDWVQLASMAAVLVALLLNFRQNREISRQTAAAFQQASVAAGAVKQASLHSLVGFSADFRAFTEAGPDLLAWFLESRRIPVGTHEKNLRYMFIFTRIDIHEAIFTAYAAGQLDAEVWQGWCSTMDADVAIAEFRTLWPVVHTMYSSTFQEFVDAMIAEQDTSTGLAAAPNERPISARIAGLTSAS